LVQSGRNRQLIVIHWTHVIGFLNENRETEVPAALNRLNIARRTDVMVIFTRSSSVWKGVRFHILRYFQCYASQ
jgi:hypothetical protein